MTRFKYTVTQTSSIDGTIVAESREEAMDKVISTIMENGGTVFDRKEWMVDAVTICPLCERPTGIEILNSQGVCNKCLEKEQEWL